MGGSSTIGSNGGQPGIYGFLGSPTSTNIPGGRNSAASWVDKSGQLWMYGGEGFDGQGNSGQLNDLWEFNPTNNEWAWMGGSSTLPAACATSGTRTLRLARALRHTRSARDQYQPRKPPRRRQLDRGRDWQLWLFGGIGSVFWASNDFSEIDQYDLWEFNTSTEQWAWMSGNSRL